MEGERFLLLHNGVTILRLVSLRIIYSFVCHMSMRLRTGQLNFRQLKVFFYQKKEGFVGLETAIFLIPRVISIGYEAWT